MHSRWLRTRRDFYDSLQQEISLITGPLSKELKSYKARYDKSFEKIWDVSSWEDLITTVLTSRIILAGDFHFFYQSQRTHFRVLREVFKKSKKPICLLLEIFDSKDQFLIDQFLDGSIDLEMLFKKTNWSKKWNQLPTQGYELLLNWAKIKKLKVFGINNSKLTDLNERDIFSGNIIENLIAKHEDAIMYTLYGDYHLADKHLKSKIKSFNKSKDFCLFLNSDKLYFDLSEHAIEDRFDILKHGSSFCILSSPPWIKLQSYLLHLQEVEDEMIAEVEDEDFEPDYTEYLSGTLSLLCKDFELQDWSSQLDVLIPKDFDFEKLEDLKFSPAEKKQLNYFITSQKNFILPQEGVQFLAKPTVNQAICLAGEFLHSQISQRQSLIWSGEDFLQKRIWIEAVSFFFNLWMNPKVKSLSEKDLMIHLEALSSSELNNETESDYAADVLRLALDFRFSELKKREENINRKLVTQNAEWQTQLLAAEILGRIMGQKIYKAYKSGALKKPSLINYLSIPLESPKFSATFDHISEDIDEAIKT